MSLNTIPEIIEDIRAGKEEAVDELCETIKKLMK